MDIVAEGMGLGSNLLYPKTLNYIKYNCAIATDSIGFGLNLLHQNRTVSWLISMPRSSSRSSILRSDSGN